MTIVVFFLGLSPKFAQAAGYLTHLEIQQGIVYFATSEAKVSASPNCVSTSNLGTWTVSLESEEGKYTYALLVTAMGGNMPVSVSSAIDCAIVDTYERAGKVWLED